MRKRNFALSENLYDSLITIYPKYIQYCVGDEMWFAKCKD